jgi:meso-butanediol dehydrogenase/(S,S)-butanediol dehydrogenase/diacetyl reductase
LSRVAFVTGGASGIGLATVERLREEGYDVWTADLTAEPGERSVPMDVSDPESVRAGLARVERLDALVLSAGVNAIAPFEDIPLEKWRRALDVNILGTYLCLQAALPALRAAPPPAHVVVVTSSAAKLPGPFTTAYNATKAGQLNLMRSAAVALAPEVLVNAINPGVTDTAMWRQLDEELPKAGAPKEWNMERRAGALPIGRPSTPQEVAEAIAFLVGERNSYMLGEDVNVNGGLALH